MGKNSMLKGLDAFGKVRNTLTELLLAACVPACMC